MLDPSYQPPLCYNLLQILRKLSNLLLPAFPILPLLYLNNAPGNTLGGPVRASTWSRASDSIT